MSLAGHAQIDITPHFAVMQGGFGQRTQPSQGVLDAVMAKALYLVDDAERILWLTADLIAIPRPLARAVFAELQARHGLHEAQICLCASHTHSGPLPFDASGSAAGVQQYSSWLIEQLLKVAAAAIASAKPARTRQAVGDMGSWLRNRRTRGTPNRIDPRVPVLAIYNATDEISALVFGLGCHPVTLGWDNMLISADFPGVAQRRLQDRYGVGTALFFNGTEGNVIPMSSPNADALDPRGYCGGSLGDAEQFGNALAAEVMRALENADRPQGLSLAVARTDVKVMPKNAELTAEQARIEILTYEETLIHYLGDGFAEHSHQLWAVASKVVMERALNEAQMRELMIACCYWLGLNGRIQQGDRSVKPVDVSVQVMRVNDTAFLALPGEVLVEVGEAWRECAGSRAFVIGLANGHLRYLPRAQHFAETNAHLHYETVTAGLEPQGVELALQAAARLWQDVGRRTNGPAGVNS